MTSTSGLFNIRVHAGGGMFLEMSVPTSLKGHTNDFLCTYGNAIPNEFSRYIDITSINIELSNSA